MISRRRDCLHPQQGRRPAGAGGRRGRHSQQRGAPARRVDGQPLRREATGRAAALPPSDLHGVRRAARTPRGMCVLPRSGWSCSIGSGFAGFRKARSPCNTGYGSRKMGLVSSCSSWTSARQAAHEKTASRICGRTSVAFPDNPVNRDEPVQVGFSISLMTRCAITGRPVTRRRRPWASGPITGRSSRIARAPESRTSSGRTRSSSASAVSALSMAENGISKDRSSGNRSRAP